MFYIKVKIPSGPFMYMVINWAWLEDKSIELNLSVCYSFVEDVANATTFPTLCAAQVTLEYFADYLPDATIEPIPTGNQRFDIDEDGPKFADVIVNPKHLK